MLSRKKIVLGITGGIAANKAIELANLLTLAKADVQTITTRAALEFITPASIAAVTGREPVATLFNHDQSIIHIELSKDADFIVIAPATANIIAKLAHGIADDALTTTILAAKCPVFIAPAMNEAMWLNEATRANAKTLKIRGFIFLGPDIGALACGDIGLGRMTEPDEIVGKLVDFLNKQNQLKDKTVLVTAGGTEEPLDGVRFLSNRSSGKMGYALAEAAARRGAAVTLVSAPSHLPPPAVAEFVAVRTAAEMTKAVFDRFERVDAVIMAAAVSDYRFVESAAGKIKKSARPLSLTLEATTDILYELGKQRDKQLLIGFAAETADLIARARRKLSEKNLDLIIANDVGKLISGFDSDDNEATLVTNDSEIPLPLMSKREMAEIIIDRLAELF